MGGSLPRHEVAVLEYAIESGNLTPFLDLGDASEHLQTTTDGYIWVAYFDEGVFGRGIGNNGLVGFDSSGAPVFKYAEFAEERDLPFIDDCYTLNVTGSTVWLSYYTDFPLVRLEDFKLNGVWKDIGANRAIAVRDEHIVIFPAYGKPYLTIRSLQSSETTIWELAAEGRLLSKLACGPPETTRTGWCVQFNCFAAAALDFMCTTMSPYTNCRSESSAPTGDLAS
jgi:hypothetical protein